MVHNQAYWRKKISFWLHDPVCKVFDVQTHADMAVQIAEALNQSVSNTEVYRMAERIAGSLTRAVMPAYTEGGGIDFIPTAENTHITHPLVKNARLQVDLSGIQIEHIVEDIKKLLKEDLGVEIVETTEKNRLCSGTSLKSYFAGSDQKWDEALYNYLFFAFLRRLRNKDIGNLGAVWDILPADTRIPDHSLWYHLGLVSAIGSSIEESPDSSISLAVFSITPVQDFIAKARKLRDYWTGSVLLSYLAFTGITAVMEELGPDHIVYPSLHNQPLVDAWLEKKYHLGSFLKETDSDLQTLINATTGIAAFPNKFVFLCAKERAEAVCKHIQDTIQKEWIAVASSVKQFIEKTCSIETAGASAFSPLWDSQIEDFWKYSWACAKLPELTDKTELDKLLPKDHIDHEYTLVKAFKESTSAQDNTARLYASSHSLIQSILAAGKMKPEKIRRPQQGEKCPLCGEREVLHNVMYPNTAAAKDYDAGVKKFWDALRKKINPEDSYSQVGEHERLCAVCSVKRFLPILPKSYVKNSLLQPVFQSADNFPSTTEMAAHRFLKKLEPTIDKKDYKVLLDYLHNADLFASDIDEVPSNDTSCQADTGTLTKDTAAVRTLLKKADDEQGICFTELDKYYAVLLMDGDKMGDLINGQTIESHWEDVLHTDVVQNIKSGTGRTAQLKDYLAKKRTMNPALHAMISDSLNNFARFGVQPAIQQAKGRLIYAGGDDVCAVLPLETALQTAHIIQNAYRLSFSEYTQSGARTIAVAVPTMKKIGLHLGCGAQGISLSGAIVIAHHKEPLREVIQAAHQLLDTTAKEKTGRNALAVRLRKRSGGDRDFSFKWDAQNVFAADGYGVPSVYDAFIAIQNAVYNGKISTGLLYKLQSLKAVFEPLLSISKQEKERMNRICQILRYELTHSGTSAQDPNREHYVRNLAGVCFIQNDEHSVFEFVPEAAIIAAFLGSRKKDDKDDEDA